MADRRWGLTLPLPQMPLRETGELVRRAEAAGYTDLWSGETNGPDGFTPLALAVEQTSTMRLGTGVVGVFTRGPALLAQQAIAMADASNGRFVLGIGASSDRIVEGWNDIPFEKPLTRVSRGRRLPARRLSPASGPRPASRSTCPRRSRCRSCSRRCGARCCGSPSRRPMARSPTTCPSPGVPQVVEQLAERPGGLRAALPLLLRPGTARGDRADRALHVRLLRHRARVRELLPLARPRRRDRRDVRALGRQGPPGGDGRSPVGPDRGDLPPRRAARRSGSGSTSTSRRASPCPSCCRSRRPTSRAS